MPDVMAGEFIFGPRVAEPHDKQRCGGGVHEFNLGTRCAVCWLRGVSRTKKGRTRVSVPFYLAVVASLRALKLLSGFLSWLIRGHSLAHALDVGIDVTSRLILPLDNVEDERVRLVGEDQALWQGNVANMNRGADLCTLDGDLDLFRNGQNRCVDQNGLGILHEQGTRSELASRNDRNLNLNLLVTVNGEQVSVV